MSEQFPIFRLATLLARQLSSPIASRIKRFARLHPYLARTVCMWLGRTLRNGETRLKLWSLRLPQPLTLAPISDAVALDAGADLLGEIVIFSLGAAIVIFEVNRQATNKETKKLAVKSQWVCVRLQLDELVTELALQERDLRRLRAALDRIVAERAAAAAVAAAAAAAERAEAEQRQRELQEQQENQTLLDWLQTTISKQK